MRLDAFLTDLLYDHDCVIIPGFGGLVANYRPARLNRITHVIKAPSKHVGFNRNLTHNDGLLANHIAQVMGISYKESMDRLSEYVAACMHRLNQQERVVWERIGVFFRDRSGSLQFIPEDQENFLLSSYGLMPLQLRPVITEQVPVTTEETGQTIAVPAASGTAWWKVAAAIALPIMFAGTVLVGRQLKGGGELNFASLNPFAPREVHASYNPRTESVEWKVLPADTESGIRNAPGGAALRYDFVADAPSETGIEISPEAPAAAEAAKPADAEHAVGKFQVIAGAFMIEENADRFVAQLRAKGFDAARAGRKGNLHLVAYGNFATESEARQTLREVKAGENPNAWFRRAQ